MRAVFPCNFRALFELTQCFLLAQCWRVELYVMPNRGELYSRGDDVEDSCGPARLVVPKR